MESFNFYCKLNYQIVDIKYLKNKTVNFSYPDEFEIGKFSF